MKFLEVLLSAVGLVVGAGVVVNVPVGYFKDVFDEVLIEKL